MAITGSGVTTMDPLAERMASLNDVTTKTPPGDGVSPRPNQQALNDGILQPSAKTMRDADAATKFKTVEQLVRSQDRLARNRWAIDTHFRRVRANVPFSRLEKIPNQSIWVAKLPNGMSKETAAAVPNKADDLCNKVEDTLMADPPKLEPRPHVEDDSAEAAAELAAEFLTEDGGEGGTNDIPTYRWALNNAFTGATSYLHYFASKTKGGYQPMQVLAHPKATDPQNPLVALVEVPSTVPGGPPEQVEERASDPVLRYVSPPSDQFPAGQFVDSAEQADRVWLPKIEIERYRRESARLFPASATVEKADAGIVIRNHTLAEARSIWPETVGQMTAEQLLQLATWKPAMADIVVPYAFRGLSGDGATGPSLDEVGSLSPLLQRRMFSYRLYVKASPEYPEGYWLDVSGADGGKVLGEGVLEYTVTLPTSGKAKRCRDIPIVALTPMQDVDGNDPTGWPFISRFAGGSEAEATLLAAFMDVCDNMLHPHVFLRSTASVDEDDWFDRLVPILLGPNDPEPTYEHFPNLPPILPLVEHLDDRQDTISGLRGAAQATDTPNAISGIAKSIEVQRALVALSGFQQALHAAMSRGGRIKCQIAQSDFTVPQLMKFSGEEGSGQVRWWTGEDFAGIDRVGIQPGTGTMMTPEGKAQYVAFLQAQNWKTPEEAAEIALPGIQSDLGLPKNPFESAIQRSIGTFLQGPTETWTKAKQEQTQVMQQFQQQMAVYQNVAASAQLNGAMAPPPPVQPQLPPLPSPFPIRPNDNEPRVAVVYMKALSKLFVNPKYEAQPPDWQQTAIDAYLRAQKALMPPPQIPKGVAISLKGDASTVGAEEQAAIQGMNPAPQGPPPAPTPTAPHPAGAMPGQAHHPLPMGAVA